MYCSSTGVNIYVLTGQVLCKVIGVVQCKGGSSWSAHKDFAHGTDQGWTLNVFIFSVPANPYICCVFVLFLLNGFMYFVYIILYKMEDIFVLCSYFNPGPKHLLGKEKRHNSPMSY